MAGFSLFAGLWHHCSADGPLLPVRGPALVVANHPNHSDPAFLTSACVHPLSFLHARESFQTPVLHRLFTRVGSIPVARTGRDVMAVREALRRLGQGEVIGVFPEGEVYPEGRPDRAYKTGAAFLALRSRAPVYPARIVGGPRTRGPVRDWLWPSDGVRVRLGAPIDLSAYYGRRIDHGLLAEVTRLLMSHVQALDAGPH
jgi:1-acyl-sn-glycerol-3-phosphate acyltransferase